MKKKKKFIVDKVTEDSFFENLLLGLPVFLDENPLISNVQLSRFPPAGIKEINCWQYVNGVVLPEDLRSFYQSTNGFNLAYKFHFPNNVGEIAGININSISKLMQVVDYHDAPTSKMFSLVKIDDVSDVLMVFSGPYLAPSFWLYRRPGAFRYLCADFITYFRMAVAHAGIPGWHFAENMTPEQAELFRLVAPGVLNRDTMQGDLKRPNNTINPTVFEGTFNKTGPSLEEKSKAIDSVCKRKQRRNRTGSTASSAKTHGSVNSPRQMMGNKKNLR